MGEHAVDQLPHLTAQRREGFHAPCMANGARQVYQVNALIRLVRTLPFAERMKFRRDLLRLTAKDSPSPGTRKRALVALITGNAVYGRVELRTAQRSR